MRNGVLPAVCVLLSAICLASVALGKELWHKSYGGPDEDVGNSVQQTTDGGFIVAGHTCSRGGGGSDVWLLKTNAQGDTLWTRTYGGTNDDAGYSVLQTTDGGYIIAGTTRSYGVGDSGVYLVKTNARGDPLWTKTYGGTSYDVGYSIQPTADGGYIIAGLTASFGAGSADVYLLKINAQGDTLWTRTYGGTGEDAGFSVRQTTDGGYIIGGVTASFGAGSYDLYLIKTNAQGDTLWTRTYGGPDDDEGNSVAQTTDGGYIIGGYANSYDAGFYLVKTNAQGDTLWTRSYGGPNNGEGYSVQPTADGGCVFAGYAYRGGDEDDYVVKTNAKGDTLWTRFYGDGGTGDEWAYSIQLTADGGYIIAGFSDTLDIDDYAVYIVRTDANIDVAPVEILSPSGTADSGVAYVPRAAVRNYNVASAVFPVTMEIGSGYSRTVQETLSSREDTVVFPPWTAEPMGSLPVKCFTSLADENPTNDTIRDSIRVVGPAVHDVGAAAILSPSGTARNGDTVIPKAQVRNFGNTAERFFGVQFRIGASYSRTVTETTALAPDSTIELTFPPWVAAAGDWPVSCMTMLLGDVNHANDTASSSVRVFTQSLRIEPDQSGRIPAGQGRTYQFYALVEGDTGGVVEVARPSAPPGWSLRLGDSADSHDLVDKDGDGVPDLDYVAPGESSWFSLDVTAPSGLAGDTASLARPTFLIAGHLGNDSLVADTAVLNLTLVPAFSIHNFPNPFSDHTAFVIGLPDDGKASLTVYTRAGARVCRVLENADLPAGVHVVRWDGVNDNGRSLAPGTYEYLLDYAHQDRTDRISKKLVLTRQ